MTTYRLILIVVIGVSLSFKGTAVAQVITDGSLGAARSLTGPNYSIPSGLGFTKGANLFHSFSQFNLTKGESALFSGPPTIQNIISRVTGGEASNIDGRISSSVIGANFYFINPKGIMFGPNASLDISGSFYATTADYLKLGAPGRFDATTPANSILTIDDPSAFGFLGSSPGGITIDRSRLWVPKEKTLSIVGRNIDITNNADTTVLGAPGGRINLASVASSGELILTPTGIDAKAFSKMGSISVTNTIPGIHDPDMSPGDISATTVDAAIGSGGIYISGGKFVTDNGWIFSYTPGAVHIGGKGIFIDARDGAEIKNGSWICTDTYSSGNAGNININAKYFTLTTGGYVSSTAAYKNSGQGGNINITGTDSITVSDSAIASSTAGAKNAGDIIISTPNLTVSDGGIIDAGTYGIGNGGAISINDANAVKVFNFGNIFSRTSGSGDAGTISIITSDLLLKDGGTISTKSKTIDSGHGGNIKITGTDSIAVSDSFIASSTAGAKNAGDITLSAPNLTFSGSSIDASTSDTGDAGNITIGSKSFTMSAGGISTAAASKNSGLGGNIKITGTESIAVSGSLIDSTTAGSKVGGDITLSTPNLIVSNGGIIVASTMGIGDAGNITIDSKSFAIAAGGQILTEALLKNTGSGGNIKITGTDSITVSGSVIASATAGSKNSGDIILSTPNLTVSDGGIIDAGTYGIGNGGAINTNNTNAVNIFNSGKIFSRTSGTGDAGTISIVAKDLLVKDGSTISTESRTINSGHGGNINITGTYSIAVSGSVIASTTAGSKNAGNITLSTPNLTVSDGGVVSASTMGIGNGGSIKINNMNNTTSVNLLNYGSILSETSGAGNAGNISIDAKYLTLQNGGRINATAAKENSGQSGDITINATGSVTVAGYATISDVSHNSMITNSVTSSSNAGIINITTPKLNVGDGGVISSNSFGKGNGGTIYVRNADIVDIFNLGKITTESNGSGNSGDIIISTESLTLSSGGRILSNAYGVGYAGNILIAAMDAVNISGYVNNNSDVTHSLIEAATSGSGKGGMLTINAHYLTMDNVGEIGSPTIKTGDAGSISINVDRLSIANGASIAVFTSNSNNPDQASGSGGRVTINAADSVEISGTKTVNDVVSHSGIILMSNGTGDAGNLSIKTGLFSLLDGANISATTHYKGNGGSVDIQASNFTMSGSTIMAGAYSTGNAGAISIKASNFMTLNGSRVMSGTDGAGTGGLISLTTPSLNMTDHGAMSAESHSTGKAGDLVLKVSSTIQLDDSAITTAATNAAGGNIAIDPVMMYLRNSSITTSVNGGAGNGGNIAIAAGTLLLKNSTIIAKAVGGNGGNISLNSDVFIFDPTSIVSASSQLGLAGVVGITAPLVDLSGNMASLPEGLLNENDLAPRQCVGTDDTSSSFVIGEPKLSSKPDRYLPSY